ncbi:hypothetical protein [Bacillus sp. B-jedd]|uniref:hypothetical protein n=1 Tax=Bacillus sp. B-jedd TaxID=1476857 RepID=UPI00051556F7|nr:hypothetical protein [Bacillus sp. B-jedd]CEG26793.1 hypothetical protein BN1002_01645 [Bacillus sp. B-jedd]
MSHSCKKWALFLIFFILLGLNGLSAQAAAGDIKITTKTGFDGKVKTGRGFPVQITIENSGKDFKGDLLVNFYPTYSSVGSKVLHVDVPKGSKKNYILSLNGISEDNHYNNQNIQTLTLYEGNWKSGKEINFRGAKNLTARFTDSDRKILGLLSENPDRLKELKSLPSSAMIDTLILDENTLPTDSIGLELIDYLVVDEFPLSSLKPAQQEAILAWVKTGGILVAGGAPNASQAYGDLYGELPMESSNEATASLLELKSSIKPGKELGSVPVFYGKTKPDSEVVVKDGNIPIVVKRLTGSGEVWQTAFSAGDQPVAGWKGYGDWFAFLLSQSHVPGAGNSFGNMNPFEQYFSEFAEVNEFFPSSQFSLGQIMLMLLVYIGVVAPGLYFLLKQRDKREHAWWIVPSFALLCSAAIFGIGAKDKITSPQVSQMGIFKAEGGQLQGLKAVSLLSNKSGDYAFSFPRGEFTGISGSSIMPVSATQRFSVFESERKQDTVTFPKVEYWSTRTIYGPAAKKEAGEFIMDLRFENSKLTGTIKNGFPYDFEQVYFWSGSKRVEVGKMKKGETVKVNENFSQNYLSGPLSPGYGYQMPNNSKDIVKMKKTKLEYSAIEFVYNKSRMKNIPIVYGFTNNPVINADLTGKSEKSSIISLVYQAAQIKTKMTGPFSLKESELSPDLSVIKGQIYGQHPGAKEIEVEDGIYEYILHLPSQLRKETTRYEELSITLSSGAHNFTLMDAETGDLIKLADTTTTIKDHPEKFVSNDGTIKIRFEKTGQNDPLVRLPSITIKGVAGN